MGRRTRIGGRGAHAFYWAYWGAWAQVSPAHTCFTHSGSQGVVMHSLDYTSCPNLAGGCILSYHSLGPYHLPNVTLQKWSLLVEADLTSKALQ